MLMLNKKNYIQTQTNKQKSIHKVQKNNLKINHVMSPKKNALLERNIQKLNKNIEKLNTLKSAPKKRQKVSNDLEFSFNKNQSQKIIVPSVAKQNQQRRIKINKVRSYEDLPSLRRQDPIKQSIYIKTEPKTKNFSSNQFLKWYLSKQKNTQKVQEMKTTQLFQTPNSKIRYYSTVVDNQYQKFMANSQILNQNIKVLGITETHGDFGPRILKFIEQNLFKMLSKGVNDQKDVEKLIKKVYKSMLTNLCELDSQKLEFSGASTTFCLFKNRNLYSFNIGNIRTIVGFKNYFDGWEGKQVSLNHTLSQEHEQNRILKNGGKIVRVNNQGYNRLRIYAQRGGKKFGLGSTRSFGDLFLAQYGVISIPDVNRVQLSSQDKLVFMGQQRIFQYLSKDQIIEICSHYYETNRSPRQASKAIDERIYKLVKQEWNREQFGFSLIFID